MEPQGKILSQKIKSLGCEVGMDGNGRIDRTGAIVHNKAKIGAAKLLASYLVTGTVSLLSSVHITVLLSTRATSRGSVKVNQQFSCFGSFFT